MNRLLQVLLMGLALHGAARADGVLLEYVPPDITDTAVLDAVKQALINRKWTVAPADAGALHAELSDRSTDAKAEFFLEGRTVRYREIEVTREVVSAGIGPANTGTRTPVKAKSSIPERWLTTLRQDLSRLLAANRAPQATPLKESGPPLSIKARLETLKELFDARLISESEYEQKRQQILEEL